MGWVDSLNEIANTSSSAATSIGQTANAAGSVVDSVNWLTGKVTGKGYQGTGAGTVGIDLFGNPKLMIGIAVVLFLLIVKPFKRRRS